MAKAMPPVSPNDLRGGVAIGGPGQQKPPEIDPFPPDLVFRVSVGDGSGLQLYVEPGLIGADPANPFMISVVEGWTKLGAAEVVRYVGIMTFFTSVRAVAVTKPEWWDDRKKKFRYPN
jgi:hypothetical protein